MNRPIFVGSSHEGLPDAAQVCAALKAASDKIKLTSGQEAPEAELEPKVWTTFFEPGSLTFDTLEDMLMECCAAVFVIRADDVVDPHGAGGSSPKPAEPLAADNSPTAAFMPRGNVLLEFGLVAGRLGLRNVALCRFDSAKLPSDLAGMTVIDIDREAANNDEVVMKLSRWASHLLATAECVPRTEVFHGYTGRWELEVQLHKWRGLVVKDPSYAIINGSFDLLIPPDGRDGFGYAHGNLAFRLEPLQDGADSTHQRYMGDFQLVHKIRNIECQIDGTVEFTSHMLGAQSIHKVGEAWPELYDLSPASEPWTYKWTLQATNRPNELTGQLSSSVPGRTDGDVKATKHSH